MLDLNKRQQFETAGELIAILSQIPSDTPVAICGDNCCFYHEEQDGSGICLDCEDLSECYDGDNDTEEERPLMVFLREEVPSRLQDVLQLPDSVVSEELIEACVSELTDNSELMFNHDKIDELLIGVPTKRGIDIEKYDFDEERKDEK